MCNSANKTYLLELKSDVKVFEGELIFFTYELIKIVNVFKCI